MLTSRNNGRLRLRAADFYGETPYFAEMFPFGQFCRKNDDSFWDGAALQVSIAEYQRKWGKRMLTSREMAALGLELRISAGRRNISPRCFRLVSSAGKKGDNFWARAALQVRIAEYQRKWGKRMLTSQEMAALGLELRISAGRCDISLRCFRLVSSAAKMTIVFEEQQRYRLVLQNTKENGANGHLPAKKWLP